MRIVKLVVCSLSLLAVALPAFDPAWLTGNRGAFASASASASAARGICSQWPLPLPSKIGPDEFQQLLNQYVAAECYKKEPGRSVGGWRGNAVPSILVSEQSAVDLARSETAKVEIASLQRTPQFVTAGVRVTNLAGHKFPSGVSFRRAFIDFRVEMLNLRGGWQTVWASGATNDCRPVVPP